MYDENPLYVSLFGKERWQTLVKELSEPTKYCSLINMFSAAASVSEGDDDFNDDVDDFDARKESKRWNSVSILAFIGPDRFPCPKKTSNGLYNRYVLDGASLLPVELLFKGLDRVKRTHGKRLDENIFEKKLKILDLCSAPGGKAIVILQHLYERVQEGNVIFSLTCNEPNFDRRRRLRRVLDDYAPKCLLSNNVNDGHDYDNESGNRSSIKVTGYDGSDSRIFEPESFDLILIDAPCSSDRHHIQQGTALPIPSSSSPLVKTQQTMFLNGLHWLKRGGRMVYATCSLNPAENDGVIENAIKVFTTSQGKRDLGSFQVLRPKLPNPPKMMEKTKWGWLVLPMKSDEEGNILSVSDRFGPLYFSTITKK